MSSLAGLPVSPSADVHDSSLQARTEPVPGALLGECVTSKQGPHFGGLGGLLLDCYEWSPIVLVGHCSLRPLLSSDLPQGVAVVDKDPHYCSHGYSPLRRASNVGLPALLGAVSHWLTGCGRSSITVF